MLINVHYPDMRGMVHDLETFKETGVASINGNEEYLKLLGLIEQKSFGAIYDIMYSGIINLMSFNKWLFHYIFKNRDRYSEFILVEIMQLLADNEKNHAIGTNLEIVFISNLMEIGRLI